ncbi:MAG: class I SAM-dependent methyltransferase [Pseudomarimonas sp.]
MFDSGQLLRCRDCGLGQRHPVPDEQTLIAMYQQTPANHMEYPFENNGAWVQARRSLQARFPDSASCDVLDVGCHTGRFLAGLPTNWRRFGIESAQAPICIARDEHNVTIIGERLESPMQDWIGKFDVVTLFDVVEHLPDPADGITRAAQLLKPGGVLLVSSADMDAWTWHWLGSGHWYLQTPQHLSLVSTRFLEHIALRNGLKLCNVQRMPHQNASWGKRNRECIEAVYWGMRQRRGMYRLPQRILQTIPGLRDLRHRRSVPWTMSLRDHLIAVFQSVSG